MSHQKCYPTVLIAEPSNKLRVLLIFRLQAKGYFVLEARNEAEALNVIKIHSRPIQVMLTSGSPDGRMLASTAKQYRRDLHVLFITGESKDKSVDLFLPEEALIKVGELVSPPGEATELETSSDGVRRLAAGSYS